MSPRDKLGTSGDATSVASLSIQLNARKGVAEFTLSFCSNHTHSDALTLALTLLRMA
jgi:hypothetical protein